MRIKNLFVFVMMSLFCTNVGAGPLTGIYQTIDDETSQPKAVVALYEYTDDDNDVELAGRIIATYRDGALVTDSAFVGQDIVWGMEWDADDNRYEDGKIRDPQSDKVYSSVIWQDVPNKLNVRGKVGPFGRTQVWNTLSGDKIPQQFRGLDTSNWKPQSKKK